MHCMPSLSDHAMSMALGSASADDRAMESYTPVRTILRIQVNQCNKCKKVIAIQIGNV